MFFSGETGEESCERLRFHRRSTMGSRSKGEPRLLEYGTLQTAYCCCSSFMLQPTHGCCSALIRFQVIYFRYKGSPHVSFLVLFRISPRSPLFVWRIMVGCYSFLRKPSATPFRLNSHELWLPVLYQSATCALPCIVCLSITRRVLVSLLNACSTHPSQTRSLSYTYIFPNQTCLQYNMLRFNPRSTNPRFPTFNLTLIKYQGQGSIGLVFGKKGLAGQVSLEVHTRFWDSVRMGYVELDHKQQSF